MCSMGFHSVMLLGGSKLHADAGRTAIPLDCCVGTAVVDVYAKCGANVDARQLVDTLPQREVLSWNAMIARYYQQGKSEKALELYSQMEQQGVRPNTRTFLGVLKACSNMATLEQGTLVDGEMVKQGCLRKGRHIHSQVIEAGFGSDVFVATTLVNMYTSCGSMLDAWHVFDTLPHRDVVLWNAMISGYARQGKGEKALQLFARMQDEGEHPNDRTFVGTLKACASLAVTEEAVLVNGRWAKLNALERGKKLHAEVRKRGGVMDIFLGNTLVEMYAKCGDMTHAQQVFDTLLETNAVTWTAMITGHVQQKEGSTALHLYCEMLSQGVMPDTRTLVAVLKACCCLAASEADTYINGEWVKLDSFQKGKKIHCEIVKRNIENNMFVGNSLVTMYTNCGSLRDAQQVFDTLCSPDVVSWNAMIAGYSQQEHVEKALELYAQMHQTGVKPDSWTFVSVLNVCGCLAVMDESVPRSTKMVNFCLLQRGKTMHSAVVRAGCQFDSFVGATLVGMYGNCGSMSDAQQAFDTLPERGVVSWTALIAGYAQHAQCENALNLFIQMQEEGVTPTNRTFASALKACSSLAAVEERIVMTGEHVKVKSLQMGRAIYALQPFNADLIVVNALIDMFASCGALSDAQQVFDALPERNVVTWTALIGGYTEQGQEERALQLYGTMQEEGVKPNNRTFVVALKACGGLAVREPGKLLNGEVVKLRCVQTGQEIHAEVARTGYNSDAFVGAVLVDMYANCGSLVKAQYVFDTLPYRDVVAWTTMLAAYAQHGEGEKAWALYLKMQEQDVTPNGRTFVCALKACCSLAAEEQSISVNAEVLKPASLEKGKEIQRDIVRFGFGNDRVVMASLVQMYAGCGDMLEAQLTFDMLPKREVTTWTALIAGYAQQNQGDKAMQCYTQMQEEGVRPDMWTFVSALKACGSSAIDQAKLGSEPSLKLIYLQRAKKVHDEVVESGFASDLFVRATLVHMYANLGSMEDAWRVFEELPQRDVVLWTAMITGYAQNGEGGKALELYVQMQEEGFRANKRTFVSLLKACGSLAVSEQGVLVDGEVVKRECLHKGKKIEVQIVESGNGSDLFVNTALVDMYAKCGSMVDAERVFDSITSRDVVSWTAMLAGYAEQGQVRKAMQLYATMKEQCVKPTEATFLSILHACSSVGSLETCLQIHEELVASGIHLSTRLATSLVHAYGKCGSMGDAQRLFDSLQRHDVFSWTALLAGYARQGEGEKSLQCFEAMQQAGIRPDGVILLPVLAACSHAGLVNVGLDCFNTACRDHSISVTVEHYICIVDLLGRAGLFNRVEELLQQMPMQPNSALWCSVLGACQKYGNVDLGKRAFECAVKLDPISSAPYVLMGNIYARAQMWEDATMVEDLRRNAGAWKKPGLSWVEHLDTVHGFLVGDTSHPQITDIHAKVHELGELLFQAAEGSNEQLL